MKDRQLIEKLMVAGEGYLVAVLRAGLAPPMPNSSPPASTWEVVVAARREALLDAIQEVDKEINGNESDTGVDQQARDA